jgi:hypothetical protein
MTGTIRVEEVRHVLLALHPAGGRPHGDPWERCQEQRAAIERWLGDGLRVTKIRRLPAPHSVKIAYPTLHRFAVCELHFGKPATTIPVLDGEPGDELQLDTGWVRWLTLPQGKKRRSVRFEDTLRNEYSGLPESSAIQRLLTQIANRARKSLRIRTHVDSFDPGLSDDCGEGRTRAVGKSAMMFRNRSATCRTSERRSISSGRSASSHEMCVGRESCRPGGALHAQVGSVSMIDLLFGERRGGPCTHRAHSAVSVRPHRGVVAQRPRMV